MQVAGTRLRSLSEANRRIGLYKEGVQQAKEASEIFERLGNTLGQAVCLIDLAWALHDDDQLDAAEEAASRMYLISSQRKTDNLKSPYAWRYIPLQGRNREGHSAFRSSARNCIPFQLARRTVLDSSPWRGCFPAMTPTLVFNVPSRTRSTIHTFWPVRRGCRPTFGINKAGLKRRNPRHSALLMCSRSSGPRLMRRGLDRRPRKLTIWLPLQPGVLDNGGKLSKQYCC